MGGDPGGSGQRASCRYRPAERARRGRYRRRQDLRIRRDAVLAGQLALRGMAGQVSVTREIQAPAAAGVGVGLGRDPDGRVVTREHGSHVAARRQGPAAGRHGSSARTATGGGGGGRWARSSTSEPGRLFTFRVTAPVLQVAEWSYDVETTAAGCRVTESWTDQRSRFFKPVAERVTGRREPRRTTTGPAMEQTLDRLKAAVEASPRGFAKAGRARRGRAHPAGATRPERPGRSRRVAVRR